MVAAARAHPLTVSHSVSNQQKGEVPERGHSAFLFRLSAAALAFAVWRRVWLSALLTLSGPAAGVNIVVGCQQKTADMKVDLRLEWDLRLDNSLIRGVYHKTCNFQTWFRFQTDHLCSTWPGFRLDKVNFNDFLAKHGIHVTVYNMMADHDHQVTFPRCIIDIIFSGIQISIRFEK